MSRFSYHARWVLPVDRPPIEGGYVTVCDGVIESVGDSVDNADVQDLGDVVLLPGLVNAHMHLEFSDCTAPVDVPGIALPEWIRRVLALRKRESRDVAAAIAQGMQESLLFGVTTVGDIVTAAPDAYARANGPAVIGFHEVIGFSAARTESALEYTRALLANSKDCLQGTDVNSRLVQCGISPHAPYTVHPRLVESLVEEACKRNLPVAMHLAESMEELQLLDRGDGPFQELLEERGMWDPDAIVRGSRPLDYLNVLAGAPRALVIHGNYVTDDELDCLASHRERMSVVCCPRTHAYFRHSEYPLLQMLERGVRVVLGTDGRASNPDLCLLSEMRFVARHFPQIPVETVLEMGTLQGAQALGLERTIGSITPGKLADLTAVACQSHQAPWEALLLSDVKACWTCFRGNVLAAS